MAQQDTVRLLRECDAGIKMGISSIDEVLEYVSEDALRGILQKGKAEHETLKSEIRTLLDDCGDEGKEPNPVAKSMSWVKTNVKLAWNESDRTIADLMTDGCNMGVKSLSRYLNQYEAAGEQAKEMARRLIAVERKMAEELRAYL